MSPAVGTVRFALRATKVAAATFLCFPAARATAQIPAGTLSYDSVDGAEELSQVQFHVRSAEERHNVLALVDSMNGPHTETTAVTGYTGGVHEDAGVTTTAVAASRIGRGGEIEVSPARDARALQSAETRTTNVEAKVISLEDGPAACVPTSAGAESDFEAPSLSLEGSIDTSAPLVPCFCPMKPFEEYAALHLDIVQQKTKPRFLIVRPTLSVGMSNRFNVVKGFLSLAILTNRALLVDWNSVTGHGRDAAKKFENNFLKAHGIPYDVIPDFMKGYMSAPRKEVWIQSAFTGSEKPRHGDRVTSEFLLNTTWDTFYAADAEVVHATGHFVNPMNVLRKNNDSVVVEALARFDGNFTRALFDSCAFRFLYQPTPDLRARYCVERSSALDGKTLTIALHIRTGDDSTKHKDWYKTLPQDVENFVACARGFEEGLAMVAANRSSDPDFITVQGAETIWVLGADSDDVMELFKKGNHTVDLGGKVTFVQGDENHRVHSGSIGGMPNSNVGPLIDFVLLSEAPLLIGSRHSSFSQNVAGLRGLPGSLRLYLNTPFQRLFGDSPTLESPPWFEDYQQGCREFVLRPSVREDLEFAIRRTIEPFIACAT